MSNGRQAKGRNAGIDLVKILAIALIVISHVIQTLYDTDVMVNFKDYMLQLGHAAADVQLVILMILRQGGVLGNTIFFVCSAWFLIGRQDTARRKSFQILAVVWTISMLSLCFYLVFWPSCLTVKAVIKSIFPTCLSNNWYMTCYIIFLFIYPWLNRLISNVSQRELLRIVLFSSALWIVINWVRPKWFFPSTLILWASIYFLIAYLRLYCPALLSNIRLGYALIAAGLFVYVAQVVVTNYLGLYVIGSLSDKVLMWASNCSPFNIMIAVGAMIVASRADLKSKMVTRLSGLSMLVYLIHENYLLRYTARPTVWQWLYTTVGYSYVVWLALGFSLVLLVASAAVALAFQVTLQPVVVSLANRLFGRIAAVYSQVERRLLGE